MRSTKLRIDRTLHTDERRQTSAYHVDECEENGCKDVLETELSGGINHLPATPVVLQRNLSVALIERDRSKVKTLPRKLVDYTKNRGAGAECELRYVKAKNCDLFTKPADSQIRSFEEPLSSKHPDDDARIEFFLKIPSRRRDSNAGDPLNSSLERESSIAELREGLNRKRSYFRKSGALSSDQLDEQSTTRRKHHSCSALLKEDQRKVLERVLLDIKAECTTDDRRKSIDDLDMPIKQRSRRSSIIQRSIRSLSIDI